MLSKYKAIYMYLYTHTHPHIKFLAKHNPLYIYIYINSEMLCSFQLSLIIIIWIPILEREFGRLPA